MLYVFIFIIIIIFGGCSLLKLESADDNAIVRKATQVGVDYFQEHYDTDVVFTTHRLITDSDHPNIGLYGYVMGDKKNLVYILLDYRNGEIIASSHHLKDMNKK
jgi:hypothetical protein